MRGWASLADCIQSLQSSDMTTESRESSYDHDGLESDSAREVLVG